MQISQGEASDWSAREGRGMPLLVAGEPSCSSQVRVRRQSALRRLISGDAPALGPAGPRMPAVWLE